MRTASQSPSLISELLSLVAPAEEAFRSRWRLSTLRRVDEDLHTALREQMDLYNAALVTGSDEEAREHTAAMVRGWRAACAALESPLHPDDAYFEGIDFTTGTHVIIGEHMGSKGRVQSKDGRNVIFMTPHEVASLVAGLNVIREAKSVFPDAELIEIYPGSREL